MAREGKGLGNSLSRDFAAVLGHFWFQSNKNLTAIKK